MSTGMLHWRPSLTRRAVLAGLVASVSGRPPRARVDPIRRVLFIGNSFLAEHDVPGQVAERADAAGRPIDTHEILRGGARLAGHWSRPLVRETLGWGWEAVVLQEHSTEALSEGRARQSAAAIRAFAAAVGGARLVLMAPWPRAEGHPLYSASAVPGGSAPRTPREMAALTLGHLGRLAEETGASLAPVPAAWAAAIASGRRLHAADGYHANAEGAALAAEVVWAALSDALA